MNNKVESKIFDTYEDAKLFQLKYGGDIIHQAVRANNSLQRSKCSWQLEMVSTDKCLFVLNLSAEWSLNNGS